MKTKWFGVLKYQINIEFTIVVNHVLKITALTNRCNTKVLILLAILLQCALVNMMSYCQTSVTSVNKQKTNSSQLVPGHAARRGAVDLPGGEEVHGDGHGSGARAAQHRAGRWSPRSSARRRCKRSRSATAAGRVQEGGPKPSSLQRCRHHHFSRSARASTALTEDRIELMRRCDSLNGNLIHRTRWISEAELLQARARWPIDGAASSDLNTH